MVDGQKLEKIIDDAIGRLAQTDGLAVAAGASPTEMRRNVIAMACHEYAALMVSATFDIAIAKLGGEKR